MGRHDKETAEPMTTATITPTDALIATTAAVERQKESFARALRTVSFLRVQREQNHIAERIRAMYDDPTRKGDCT